MKIIVSNTIRVEEPTDEIKLWCRNNLIIANPEHAKKSRMGFYTGNIPQKIYMYEQDGDDLILPFGVLRQIPHDNAELISKFSKPDTVDYGEDVPLYDYQIEAVEEVYAKHYGILQSPCGSGKTQMGIALVKKFGKRALWICHTFDLLQQSKDRAEMYMSTDLIGTITDGRVNIGKGITFATVQTLSALDLTRYKDIWDLCIVDECHHVCVSANSTTMFSKVLNNISARHKFGLSATVDRSDGLICATYALLGEIVYTVPKEAIKDRLVTVGIKPIGTGIEISRKCLNTDGTLNYIKLINYLIGNIDRNQIIINALLENIELSCLILSDRVDHLEYLKNYLSPYCKVAMIHGKMTSKKDKAERKQALEDMRSGEIRMLFASYSLAKEALDIPRLERVFFTTPVKGYTVVTQAIGRIERVFDDKTNPICYDFVDNIQYCVKAYKQRLQHYKKAGCYIVEGSCNGN